MAHYSEIDSNNKVLRILVVPDERENDGQQFLANELGFGGTWIKTSYNTWAGKHSMGKTPLRKNFGRVGYTYDPVRDAFIPPKPEDTEDFSFQLDESTCLWVKSLKQK